AKCFVEEVALVEILQIQFRYFLVQGWTPKPSSLKKINRKRSEVEVERDRANDLHRHARQHRRSEFPVACSSHRSILEQWMARYGTRGYDVTRFVNCHFDYDRAAHTRSLCQWRISRFRSPCSRPLKHASRFANDLGRLRLRFFFLRLRRRR